MKKHLLFYLISWLSVKTDGSWGSDFGGKSGGYEYDGGFGHGYEDSFDSGNSYEGNGYGSYNGWDDKWIWDIKFYVVHSTLISSTIKYIICLVHILGISTTDIMCLAELYSSSRIDS